MPLVCHGRARRGQVSAGARSEYPGRGGSVARRGTQERRGQGLGVQAAATAGAITLCARWAGRARVEYGCEGCRRRFQPSGTERRGLCVTSSSRRRGCRGPCRPRSSDRLLCNAARREMWGCRDEDSGSSAVPAAGVATRGRYWEGRGVLPLTFHGGGRWGNASGGTRVGRPERRGSAVRREMHGRRALGVGAHVASADGVALTRVHRDARTRAKSGRRKGCTRRRRPSLAERRGLCGLRSTHPQQ